MKRSLTTQFCELCEICNRQLEIVGIPEVITTINILKVKFNCPQCKCNYSVTWNFQTNFCTRFKEK